MKIIEKIKGEDIQIEIEYPYTFENGFKSFINQGLEKGYDHGKLKAKKTKEIVGKWKVIEKNIWQKLYYKLMK